MTIIIKKQKRRRNMIKFTMEEELIVKSLRDFVENEVKPAVPEIEKTNAIPMELWHRCGELGFIGVCFPEEYGGMGMRSIMDKIVLEEIAKESPALALAIDAHHLCCRSIMMLGSKAQKEYYLPKLVNGELVGASAASQSEGGQVYAETKPIGTFTQDGILLNSTKVFITNSSFADIFIVVGLVDGNYCQIVVDKATEGLSYGGGMVDHKMGMHGSGTGTVRLTNVLVPMSNMLVPDEYDPSSAFTFASCYLDISAISLGIAEGAFYKTKDFLMNRKRNGKIMAGMPVISKNLALMKAKIEMMRSMLWATTEINDESPDPLLIHATKPIVTDACLEVTQMAVVLHGGAGYMEDTGVARYHRDAMCNVIGEVPSDMHLVQVALQMGLPIEDSVCQFPVCGDRYAK